MEKNFVCYPLLNFKIFKEKKTVFLRKEQTNYVSNFYSQGSKGENSPLTPGKKFKIAHPTVQSYSPSVIAPGTGQPAYQGQ